MASSGDIYLSFEEFDLCVNVLSELISILDACTPANTSGVTAFVCDSVRNTIHTLSYTQVCPIIMHVLSRHAWNGVQFTNEINAGEITKDIDNLIDRLYAL